MRINHLTTEQVNDDTIKIDQMSTLEVVNVINAEDRKVADAVAKQSEHIALAADMIVEAFKNQGRLIYIGAGTSGRLGVLDASECPPTFGVDSSMVVGLIAGGDHALRHAVEGCEDDKNAVIEDLKSIDFSSKDILVGIAASGRTPYVVSGLAYANSIGAKTISIACNIDSDIGKEAMVAIEVIVGPEALSGSTRMKAGTAQKMVLNMLTTTSMIKLGKTYKNLMIDMVPTNAKLKQRAINLLSKATELSEDEAKTTLVKTDWNLKAAIVMIKKNCSIDDAILALEKHGGFVAEALL